MTQYKQISGQYGILDQLPYREMEVANVLSALKLVSLQDKNVIDFACGTGFYSEKLLEWGAGSVTGVDISPEMLSLAESRLEKTKFASSVRFIAGDGAFPQSYAPNNSPEYYDLAFAGWFLNYSGTQESLTAMFRTVALNLKPGGLFMAIVPHPTEDLHARAAASAKAPFTRMHPRNDYTPGQLPSGDGWGLRVNLDDDGTNFMTYHLLPRVYEQAARSAGFDGRLEWRREVLLEGDWKAKQGLTSEEWQLREENPHLGILMIWKN
ncbi:hypothetical protein NQ176_g1387 [Zarea fungicola]|uniref:Uncharacterized protein n=1 Tax=Zarea fungicola TaxID=93591 RepID=A0ACC1NU35_9HYPO|nr:hypothetical protein NQ176_g1387 [Lecanicillium fungicola]